MKPSLRGRRVLVTGATGFIGSALTRALARERALVHILVRGTSSPRRLEGVWDRLERHVGDLSDPSSLAAAVRASRPEVVFHLAKERAGAGFERQAAATRSLAQVLRAQAPELRRLVRTAHDAPTREHDLALARELAALGLPAATLELFLVYGPQMPREDFPRSMAEGAAPERLSAAIKDFVWIDDVVQAYLLASHASGIEGLTLPIGTGRGVSEAQAAAILLRVLGSSQPAPAAPESAEGHPADPGPARRLLGWTARVQLEQGLALLARRGERARPDPREERRQMAPWLGAPGPRAAAPAARGPWALIARAAESFQRGDLPAADAHADAFIGLLPRAAAGPAMKALLAAQAGDRAQTERWLESCGPKGPEGWALALRGLLRSRWGEHAQALADLAATRRSERSAWALAARADGYNRAGRYVSALTELSSMRRALPGSPEPELRASAIHLEQAQYEEAAECLARAARLAPKDAAVRRQLSRVRFVEGDLPRAREAIDQACRLAPEDLSLREERLRLCVLQDDHRAADELLARPWPEGAVDFWTAYRACRAKRHAQAAEVFGRLARACPDGSRAATAAFYAFVARVLASAPARPAPAGKSLAIVGLGYRHPYQASVEVLWELASCQEFFSNLSDATVADLLGLYGVPMRTIVFRRTDGQSTPCARLVMKRMKDLRRGAVVTRGQPNYYGRLAYRLVQDCRKAGISCRIPPSVSIADLLPSVVGRAWEGGALGLEVRDTNGLDGTDPRLPLVVYNFSSGPRRREQAQTLAAGRPASEPCWLLAGSGQWEYEPAETTAGGLPDALAGADPAATLLLAPRRAG